MIYTDESTVKIDKTVLPGLFKSLEVKGEATVDEQEVEGQSKKPKQATGYEDIKVILELVLDDGPEKTQLEKLEVIQNLFRKPGQAKPEVHEIINAHTAARGVKQVVFKNLTSKRDNKKNQLAVTLEFWEYVAMTVTATQSSSGSSSGSGGGSSGSSGSLNQDYQDYLPARGTPPISPAQDNAASSAAVAAAQAAAASIPG